MSQPTWIKPTSACFHLLTATPSETCDWLTALGREPNKLAARLVRGKKSPDKIRFLDEISAALQFPYYFGDNWDALHDCLVDLSWLHAPAVVVCIADADQLLSKAPGEFKKLIEVLQSACKEWNHPDKPKTARAFHVVLQTAAGQEAPVKAAWNGAGVKLEAAAVSR